MYIVIIILNLLQVLVARASSPQTLLLSTDVVSQLIHGFKEYPLIVWTSEKESFPDLAEILTKEAFKEYHPLELWQQAHVSWRPRLKVAPGKPLYAIFPPTLAHDKRNLMLQMLGNFTTCQNFYKEQEYATGPVVLVQMYASIFLFLSTTHDGSQEDPSFMHMYYRDYCYTPTQLLFLKFDYVNVQSTSSLRLESLRAVRMRCEPTEGFPCTQLVKKDDPKHILSYLSTENIRKLTQTDWRIAYKTNVYLTDVYDEDITQLSGTELDSLQDFYAKQSFRALMQLDHRLQIHVPYYELFANVNITVTSIDEFDMHLRYEVVTVVGYILPNGIPKAYKAGLSLVGSIHHTLIYGADYSSQYNPLMAKSLFGACGTLELLILFALASIISALQLRRYRLGDLTEVLISTLAPLVSQSCQFKSTRFNILYYIWMVSTWFSTLMYLTLLQSQRVVPQVQVGNETFKDLEDREMSFYASYRDFDYATGDSNPTTEVKSGTLSRLSEIVQSKPMWGMPNDEFRAFFELSEWAYLVEAKQVETMSRILTKVYSKNYLVLPEKIAPQMEWSTISIPQGEYVVESFKRIKENGIWDYWYQVYLRGRNLNFEEGFHVKLQFQEITEDTSDNFERLQMSDSVLMEISTLCGLILCVVAVVHLSAMVYFAPWACIGSEIMELLRWLYTYW